MHRVLPLMRHSLITLFGKRDIKNMNRMNAASLARVNDGKDDQMTKTANRCDRVIRIV